MEDYDQDLGCRRPALAAQSPWKPGSSGLSSLPGTQTGADQANRKHFHGEIVNVIFHRRPTSEPTLVISGPVRSMVPVHTLLTYRSARVFQAGGGGKPHLCVFTGSFGFPEGIRGGARDTPTNVHRKQPPNGPPGPRWDFRALPRSELLAAARFTPNFTNFHFDL